jgi:hypothetical protein
MAKRKYKAEEGDDPKKKMRCPITRRHFLEAAPLLIVTIDEVAHTALPLENSTGSFGWNVNGKMAIRVGGIVVPVQINCNFTVIGSRRYWNRRPHGCITVLPWLSHREVRRCKRADGT